MYRCTGIPVHYEHTVREPIARPGRRRPYCRGFDVIHPALDGDVG